MKIGIMQSYFFPYIGYFQLIDACDKFVLYEHVTFRKKSWITRNRILERGKNEPIYINVPVKKQSSLKNIEQIEIDSSFDWRKKLLNALLFNYKKAPYYNEVFPWLKEVVQTERKYLHEYNAEIIVRLSEKIGIKTEIIFTNKTTLLEQRIKESNVGRDEIKSERIIELMKYYKGNKYINPIGGKELYNKEYFKNRGFELSFILSEKTNYKQFNLNHIPYLSILDVLFHNGFKKTSELIKKYRED